MHDCPVSVDNLTHVFDQQRLLTVLDLVLNNNNSYSFTEVIFKINDCVLIILLQNLLYQVDLGHNLLENLETVVKLIGRGISRGTLAPKFEYTGINAIGEIITCNHIVLDNWLAVQG